MGGAFPVPVLLAPCPSVVRTIITLGCAPHASVRAGLEAPPKPQMARTTLMKIEPKTFFANERTFLAWLHMAVTLGSISAALLGFAAG